MDLFEKNQGIKKAYSGKKTVVPLADRMRPARIEDFMGQEHLTGPGKVIREILETGEAVSMVLWGPPGTGKTTLARLIADRTGALFFSVSAVAAGLVDIRKIMQQAQVQRRSGRQTLLFIDEIHRFNKAQQDALLHTVEDGTLVLIGATTENPSIEVIAPLLSRCRVYRLEPLSEEGLRAIVTRALSEDRTLKDLRVVLEEEGMDTLIRIASGDARTALNGLDLCSRLVPEKNGKRTVTSALVKKAMQRAFVYDKKGDAHYAVISAFIKSMRGSDPDAAVYWLARMLESGEDPLFIARRMLIFASEDVGNSDPAALILASAAFQAVHSVGMPESRIILSQAATYLASCTKSNAAYVAIQEASEDARETADEPVPVHLVNAPTPLMKSMGYGKGYQYAHDYEGGFTEQVHLPERLKEKIYYRPGNAGREKEIRQRLEGWWKKRRKES